MKKIYGILIASVLLLAIVPVTAIANSETDLDQDFFGQEPVTIRQKNNLNSQLPDEDKFEIDNSRKYVKIHGIWGFAGDNISDGNFGGRIIKFKNVHLLRGIWNTTDNESKGKIVGILKRGYFNGRVIMPDGSKYRITGLYRIDNEKNLLKLRWMTVNMSGWAVGKLIKSDQ